ncbi:hypothetical protein H5185_12435 [Shewanella sp. SG44-6]|jgi:hypothetical protein|uniref:hypothetical protein n=1 Tax=Shewanella sp. SG44-6 TaxID=2760959 RepID=UPI00160126FA|nr:hypothetical protein [Shewanella sp. SG44-6]MBB1390222.1 hypothetical protein [Shewanella sp. SG44-6]
MSANTHKIISLDQFRPQFKKKVTPQHQRLNGGSDHVSSLREQVFTDITPGDIHYLVEYLLEVVTGDVVEVIDNSDTDQEIVAKCDGFMLSVTALNCDDWDEDNGAVDLAVSSVVTTQRTFDAAEIQIYQSHVSKSVRYVCSGKRKATVETQVSFSFGASMSQMENAVISVLLASMNLKSIA